MATLMSARGGRRCDASCYGARGLTCDCVCGGRYHGKGLQLAVSELVGDQASGTLSEEQASAAQRAHWSHRETRRLVARERVRVAEAARAGEADGTPARFALGG